MNFELTDHIESIGTKSLVYISTWIIVFLQIKNFSNKMKVGKPIMKQPHV